MTRTCFSLLLIPALALAACNGARPAADDTASARPRISAEGARPMDTTPWQIGPARRACLREGSGLTLPAGFCAVIVADSLPAPRHIAVAPNGDVYAALPGRRNGPAGVLALRDTTGDGRADVRQRFYDRGGSGIAIHDGWLYFAPNDGVVRWRMQPGALVPPGAPETLVSGLPVGGHASKSLALDGRGGMWVNVGSLSNACQEADRIARSPGRDPCPELATRAGTWRFDAARAGQTQADGERWATGIRNGYALAFNAEAGVPFAVVHGRDQLSANWGYTEQQNAETPSEEMFRLDRGTDGGWPYCIHHPELNRKVLAPEYGGDLRQAGRCASTEAPIVAFPAHWAPNALAFYTGTQFPARYRGGAFVAFHGSWNRAPLPQQGFNVAFVPFRGGAPSGAYAVFAETAAPTPPPADAPAGAQPSRHRPTGLAVGPDGSLYLSDDGLGRIWKIMYVGER